MATRVVTRFAPSPSGHLHLGHAYAALFAHAAAAEAGGRFLVRMEDIDSARCRPQYDSAILEDLSWLGLAWETPVWRQSDRRPVYAEALNRLEDLGVLYPCFCTRAQIRAEIAMSPSAPHKGGGPRYPGTCRAVPKDEAHVRIAAGATHALRLNARAAAALAGARCGRMVWRDQAAGPVRCEPEALGDVVLARKDVGVSYHLAVVVDDAAAGVSLVTRGLDLWTATHVHRLLQALLDLPIPEYHHHRLIVGADGQRLATRDGATALHTLRTAGWTPADVRERVGRRPGEDGR